MRKGPREKPVTTAPISVTPEVRIVSTVCARQAHPGRRDGAPHPARDGFTWKQPNSRVGALWESSKYSTGFSNFDIISILCGTRLDFLRAGQVNREQRFQSGSARTLHRLLMPGQAAWPPSPISVTRPGVAPQSSGFQRPRGLPSPPQRRARPSPPCAR